MAVLRQGARKSFDGRGRVVGTTVQIAKPGVPSDTLESRYANKWYDRYWTFDAANREVEATTGSQALVASNGESKVRTLYSQRGTVRRVESSYEGTINRVTGDTPDGLISSITRTADGLITEITYGDLARTKTTNTYNTKRWLESVTTSRAQPAVWSMSSCAC